MIDFLFEFNNLRIEPRKLADRFLLLLVCFGFSILLNKSNSLFGLVLAAELDKGEALELVCGLELGHAYVVDRAELREVTFYFFIACRERKILLFFKYQFMIVIRAEWLLYFAYYTL